jgi:hypothetical protein
MNPANRPPELLLEQLAVGELPPDIERDLRARFGSERIDACLAELKAESAQSLSDCPPEAFKENLRVRVLQSEGASTQPGDGHISVTRHPVSWFLSFAFLSVMTPRNRALAGMALALVLGMVLWIAVNRQVTSLSPIEMAAEPGSGATPGLTKPALPSADLVDSQSPNLREAKPEVRFEAQGKTTAQNRAPDERLAFVETAESRTAPYEGGVRFKGDDLQLLAFVQSGTDIKPLRAGDTVCAGQFLQLHYLTTESGYGMILSVDGRGHSTHHLPQGLHPATKSATLTPRSVVPLPHSYELDQAPHFERFFFFMASEPFALSDIEPALKRYQAALIQGQPGPRTRSTKLKGLPKRIHATSLLLMKGCGT